MNKKKLMELLAKKEARKADVVAQAAASEDVAEIRNCNAELETLNGEITDLEEIIASTPDEEPESRSAGPVGKPAIIASYGMGQTEAPEARKAEVVKIYEQRGADLKARKPVVVSMNETPEERAVTLASGTLVVQEKYASNLNGKFNEVSSLIDMVNAVPLNGGDSYVQAFEVSDGEGDYSTETGAYTPTDPTVDYVEIGKAKITAYSEITDEASKLPNIDYQALVVKNVRNSIRKKITRQLIAGAGGANAIVGIFNAPVKVIPANTDVELAAIDADTLDLLVFGYGGDTDVEGAGYLILNKKDLADFAALRDANGQKLYEITVNGNTGEITSKGSFRVPYIINDACPRLSTAAAGTYCMAYGKLATYEMPVFSPLTIEESRDFKFSTGQIAYRGAVWVGGNVASYKGFTRIKKK